MHGHNGAGRVAQWQTGGAQGGLHIRGILVQPGSQARAGFEHAHAGQRGIGKRQGQRSAADEHAAAVEHLLAESRRAQDRAAIGAEGLTQGHGLDDVAAADVRVFDAPLAGAAQHAAGVGVVHQQLRIFGEDLQVFRQGSGGAIVGEHAVGEYHQFRLRPAALHRVGQGLGILRLESEDGAFEEAGGVGERGMDTVVQERVKKPPARAWAAIRFVE